MKLLAVVLKTARMLYRNPAELVVLFAMPATLVLVITLVQEDAFRTIEGATTRILFVDHDGGAVAGELAKGLKDTGHFDVVREIGGQPVTEEMARAALARGKYPVGLILPKGLSDRTSDGVREMMTSGPEAEDASHPPSAAKGSAEASPPPAGPGDARAASEVVLCFDPAIRGINRRFIVSAVRSVIGAAQMKLMLDAFGEAAGEAKSASVSPREIVTIRETFAGHGKAILPTSVQENVPAWTLFAMFLIVIPVSGLIIKERSQGTLARLRTLPVSAWTLLLGNLIVYAALCLLQFVVMLLIGLLVLPRLGTPRLEMGNSPAAMVLVAVASALAATGFGMMVANVARSNDVAAFFSSTFTVIAALLGGIMVPVFLMPPGIQSVSRFSPLNWGLNGFLEVFLRGGDVKAVLPDVLRLMAFFVVTLAIAVACFKRRESSAWPRRPEWRER